MILAGSNTVSSETEFILNLGLKGVSETVYAHDITLRYDKDLFEFKSATSVKEGLQIMEINNKVDGIVRFILVSCGQLGAVTHDSDIINITFKTKNASGSGEIAVESAMLSIFSGFEIEAGIYAKIITAIKDAMLCKSIVEARAMWEAAVEGMDIGQYPAGLKDRLMQAINIAQGVLENKSATQEMIDAAYNDLNPAKAKFAGLVITASTGDVNGKLGITIGDLGFVAENYGKKEGSDGRNAIKAADINGDGEIGLYDLVFVAKKVINN